MKTENLNDFFINEILKDSPPESNRFIQVCEAETSKFKIADRTATAIQTTVKVAVLHDGEIFNFTADVFESEKHKFVTDIHYLDKYKKPLKNSVKKKIRAFLSEELLK